MHAVSSSKEKSVHLEALGYPGRQCMIRVTDNGEGIGEEDLDKIFIPFYSTREGGSGIGLSLVRNIMRTHRGSVQVSSRQGSGTTFSLLF
jgi:two-component system nitrogen regulation sensor histidine kinase NtrY